MLRRWRGGGGGEDIENTLPGIKPRRGEEGGRGEGKGYSPGWGLMNTL